MRVALIGATGSVGTRILDELVRRGHRVTAIARRAERLKATQSFRKGNAPQSILAIIFVTTQWLNMSSHGILIKPTNTKSNQLSSSGLNNYI